MRIDCDPAKAVLNEQKHGVSFDEAAALLRSPAGFLERFDEAHSDDEDRFIAIGPIRRGVVAVVFAERDDDVMRLVSARFATVSERRLYDEWASGAGK